MEHTAYQPPAIGLTSAQQDLQTKLAEVISKAIPAETELGNAQERAQDCYRTIGELLVDLRHEFPGPDGEPHDLQGRTSAYRKAVRDAYALAGADFSGPIPKRLTVGAAYWVRKILIERHGERTLYDSGIIRRPPIQAHRGADTVAKAAQGSANDPTARLNTAIGILNTLAVDPRLMPSEEAVRSALRAVLLLQRRLKARQSAPSVSEVRTEAFGTALRQRSAISTV
ncbi:MAG: hypothetical protein ACRD0K_20845 [Egibacteraceae bacterium]